MSEKQAKAERQNIKAFTEMLNKNIKSVIEYYFKTNENKFIEIVSDIYYSKYPNKKK